MKSTLRLFFGFILGLAIWQRQSGLNPSSLWYDDVWVAALTRFESLPQLVKLGASSPLGFVVLEKWVQGLGLPLETSLQLLPFFCGLLIIPLLAFIAWQLTKSRRAAILVGVLTAMCPVLAEYSCRVKHYTLDAFIAVILMAITWSCVRPRKTLSFAWLASVAILSLPFSLTTPLIGCACLGGPILAALMARLVQSNQKTKPTLIRLKSSAALFALAAGLYYGLVMRLQSGVVMTQYWRSYFFPVQSPSLWPRFVQERWGTFLSYSLPIEFRFLTILLPLGWWWLFQRHRVLALVFALLYGGALLTNVAGMYPLGTQRTDLYAYPFTILLVGLGLEQCCRWGTMKFRHSGMVVVLVLLAIFVKRVVEKPVEYVPSTGRQEVSSLQRDLRDSDALIINQASGYFLGVYGSMTTRLVSDRLAANNFRVEVLRSQTLQLSSAEENSEVGARKIATFLGVSYPRLLYFPLFSEPSVQAMTVRTISSLGFQIEPNASRTDLYTFLNR